MKRWQKIVLPVLALLIVFVLWRTVFSSSDEETTYLFTEVMRTNLEATVSSTGTLSTVEAVDVGTQVSGQVLQVLVDYNDIVEKGQLMALIDTEGLDAALQDARARVVQAEAQKTQAEAQLVEAEANLADAQATHNRNAPLVDQGYLSQSEFQPINTSLQTAQANVHRTQAALRSAEAQVAQAEAQVTQARKDRRNAEIRAPIAGIVIERSVDAGQTVAASFETPTLFVLAENLERMQILADVDESDIGQIKQGRPVSFTVPAYPDETYDGTVREVRLQPNTTQNVVTYTVVVEVANTDGHLLPGMTATIDFVTDQAEDVLAVSTAALQLQVTPAMQESMARNLPGPPEGGPPDGVPTRPAGAMDAPPEGMPFPGAGGFGGGNVSMLWYMDDEDQFHAVPVRTGLSSGPLTEITPIGPASSEVTSGLRVIEQIMTQEPGASQGGFPPPPGGGNGGPPR